MAQKIFFKLITNKSEHHQMREDNQYEEMKNNIAA